jgi:dienelactone hydrolase
MSLVAKAVHYVDQQTPLTGYLVHDDDRNDQRPGVIVVHGGAGVDDHARDRAHRLANLGYVVLAIDMYGDGVPGNRERIIRCIGELRKDPSLLRARARAGVEWLRSYPHVDGRLAAVGYCFGGMTALEMARDGMNLTAVASIHGNLLTDRPAEPGSIKARVLVCHGALDPHAPMAQVMTFSEEMRDARADWQVIVYGGAMHGFTHVHAGSSTPGVAYDPVADGRSSAALQTFLADGFAARS